MLVGPSAGEVMVGRHYLRRATRAAVVAKFENDVVELEFGGVRFRKIGAAERRWILGWIVRRKFLPFDWDRVGRTGDNVGRQRERMDSPEQTNWESHFADARASFFEPGMENVA